MLLVTIPSGATESALVELGGLNDGPVVVVAPAALTGIVTMKVGHGSSGTLGTLQTAGVDITFPAGKATAMIVLPGHSIKMVSTGAEAANRVFTLMAAE